MPRCYLTLTNYPINLDAMCDEERALVERMFEAYRCHPPLPQGVTNAPLRSRHPFVVWTTTRWNPLRDEIWAFLTARGHPFGDGVPKFTSMMIQKGRWKSTRRNPYFAHDIHFDLSFRIGVAYAAHEDSLPKLAIEEGAW